MGRRAASAVGTVVFPRIDPDARDVKLAQLLAQELRANPGNWQETSEGRETLPATRFTAARALTYRTSQDERQALADDQYDSFFDTGEIGPALAGELIRRYNAKRQAGHWAPDVGSLSWAERRARPRSDVELEEQHVAVGDDVLLALHPVEPLLARGRHRSARDQVVVCDGFGLDEPAFEVGVDDAGGLGAVSPA